jgi:hypothetical protein
MKINDTKTILAAFAILMLCLLLAACNSEDGFFGAGNGGAGGDSAAASITLLASSPQLGSSDSASVMITAIVMDGSNNLLDSVPVAFSASSGALELPPASGGSQPLTNASGQVVATLKSGGDYQNRTITVTAGSGGVTSSVDINVTGTSLSISGESSATIGDNTTLTIVLTDSAGAPIPGRTVTVSSELGNPLSATTLTTSSAGQVQVVVTAITSGTDTITASAQGISASRSLAVSGDQFQLTTPASGANLEIGQCSNIQVNWRQNNVAVIGEAVGFSTTRGTLYSDAGCTTPANSAVTDGTGTATLRISSNNAGPAVLTAFVASGPSTSRSINFIATVPATISLQASPTTIGPNNGSQTNQQSTITAILRDANNNLVAGKAIRFSIIQDNSGGSLTTATATTDTLGRASTTYVSSSATTAKDGVVIRAEVDENTAINTMVSLTVAQSPLFVRLGTGNLIENVGQTQYNKKYTVIVTDANGNAAANASVNLSVTPVSFTKGSYIYDTSVWVQTAFDINLDPVAGNPQSLANRCASEDLNENGILDGGEDINQDGQLTPGNVVSVPPAVTTGANGTFEFDVIYPRQYGNWTRVRLSATTSVAGTESSDSVIFWLPVAAADMTNQNTPPPGTPSPFGYVTGDCSSTD